MLRTAIIDTGTSGLGLDVVTLQGAITARTHAPYGVALTMGSQTYEVTSNALAEIGRFFLAAAVHCGQDI